MSTMTLSTRHQRQQQYRKDFSCSRLLLLFLCLLSLLPSPAYSSGFEAYESADEGESKGFHIGGTAPRCWTADGTSPIDETDNNLNRPSGLTFLDACPPETALEVQVNLKPKYDKYSQPPFGWKLQISEKLHVTVSGKAEFVETGVVVLQLCPIGLNALCVPAVPAMPPLSSRRRLDPEDSQRTQPPFEPHIDSNVQFKYNVTREEFENGVNLTLTMSTSGTYSIAASIVFINSTNILAATNIPRNYDEQLVTVFETEPLGVSHPSLIAVVTLSCVSSAILLFLLWHTIRIRATQVFELTQGKFVVAMLFSGALATSSLVLFDPKNDLYCKLWQPLIVLPLHIMYSILLGRMWRIRAVISPLLLLTLEKKEHWSTKLVNWVSYMTSWGFLSSREPVRGKKIRRAITDLQLARVIIFLVLPQAIIQLLILTIEKDNGHITYKDTHDFSDGIEICRYRFDNSALQIFSLIILGVLFFMLLVLARGSKDLPSLFNETENILDITWITLSLTAGGFVLGLATRTEETTADVRFLVKSFITGITTVYTCFKITCPKLILAWSGSRVLVTKLIADHNFNKKNKKEPHSFMSSVADPTSFSHSGTLQRVSVSGHQQVGGSAAPPRRSTIPSMPMTLQEVTDSFEEDILEQELEDEDEENDKDDDNETRSTQSSVILMEDEGLDAFPMDDDSEALLNQGGSQLDSSQPLNRSTHNPSSGWFRMQDAMAKNFGWSSRQLSAEGPPSDLGPAASQGSGPGPVTLSELVGAVTGSRHTKAPRLLSRRGLFATPNSNNSDAPPLRRRHNKGSFVHNTGLQAARTNRFSIAGGIGGRPIGTRISIFGSGTPSVPSPSLPSTPTSHAETIGYNPNRADDKIRISETEPPGRRLLLRMIDVQRMLSKVNQAVLTGLSVDREDWEEIREGCTSLGNAFANEVIFAWEEHLVNAPRGPAWSHDGDDDEEADAPINPTKKLSWEPTLGRPSFQDKGTYVVTVDSLEHGKMNIECVDTSTTERLEKETSDAIAPFDTVRGPSAKSLISKTSDDSIKSVTWEDDDRPTGVAPIEIMEDVEGSCLSPSSRGPEDPSASRRSSLQVPMRGVRAIPGVSPASTSNESTSSGFQPATPLPPLLPLSSHHRSSEGVPPMKVPSLSDFASEGKMSDEDPPETPPGTDASSAEATSRDIYRVKSTDTLSA